MVDKTHQQMLPGLDVWMSGHTSLMSSGTYPFPHRHAVLGLRHRADVYPMRADTLRKEWDFL